MRKIIIVSLLIIPIFTFGQKREVRLMLGGGLSKCGTGDLPGYNLVNQMDINLNKTLFLSPGLQFTNNGGTETVGSFQLNYVTAGVNLFTNMNLVILNKSKHLFSLGAGPLVRFQNSSVPDVVGMNRDASGQQILFIKYSSLHTINLGYNISPAYYYQLSKKMFLGAKYILQNDTNGDIITSKNIFVGIKF